MNQLVKEATRIAGRAIDSGAKDSTTYREAYQQLEQLLIRATDEGNDPTIKGQIGGNREAVVAAAQGRGWHRNHLR